MEIDIIYYWRKPHILSWFLRMRKWDARTSYSQCERYLVKARLWVRHSFDPYCKFVLCWKNCPSELVFKRTKNIAILRKDNDEKTRFLIENTQKFEKIQHALYKRKLLCYNSSAFCWVLRSALLRLGSFTLAWYVLFTRALLGFGK